MEINEIISSGLLELYVAGLASEEESSQVEQWAAQYPAVKEELRAIETALEAYANLNAVEPADGMKEKLMAVIASKKTDYTSSSNGNMTAISSVPNKSTSKTPVAAIWKRLAAASVVLLAGSAIYSIILFNKNKNKQDELAAAQKEINNAQASLQKMQQAHLGEHHDMEALLSGNMVKIELEKTAVAPDGCKAVVFWDKKTGAVFIDPCRMTKAPPGKTYQLWAIVNGKPVDAGIVKTGTPKDKYSIQKMKVFEKAEGFAVTLEKEGGNTVPTLEQTYVSGKVA